MEPTPELIRALRRDDIAQARAQSPAQKFLAGAELFDYACGITMSGIRAQHPALDEHQVRAELRRRLAIAARLEAFSLQREDSE